MSENFFSPTAIASCLSAAVGMYCLLTGRRRVVLGVGVGFASLALVLLWMEFAQPLGWWQEVQPTSAADSPLFVACGLAAILAAGMTVTAKRATVSAVWFVATLCSTAALYAIHDAQFLAVGTLFIGVGSTASILLLLARRAESMDNRAEQTAAHEPLLACVCGGLLAAGLLGVIHHSLAASAVRNAEQMPSVVERWRERAELPAVHRPLDAGQLRTEQAGQSMFADHPVAVLLLSLLLLVAIVAGVLLSRGTPPSDWEFQLKQESANHEVPV